MLESLAEGGLEFEEITLPPVFGILNGNGIRDSIYRFRLSWKQQEQLQHDHIMRVNG